MLLLVASCGDADGTRRSGGPLPDPTYGGQLNQSAVLRVPAEGRATAISEELPGSDGDGDPFSLRRPRYELVDLANGPLAADVRISPRAAPFLIGLGLLEAVAGSEILARQDADDADGDGISGRANSV